MTKTKLIDPYPLIHPNPIVLLGTVLNDKVNFTTIGDVAVAGIKPALIMISVKESHLATTNIYATKKFSINVPTKDMVEVVDYCGVHSGKKMDKASVVDHEIVEGYAVAKDAPISIFCEVLHTHQIEQRVIMIAQVKKTMIDEDLIVNHTLDLNRLKTLVYGLDNKYYTLGDIVASGYEAYKKV